MSMLQGESSRSAVPTVARFPTISALGLAVVVVVVVVAVLVVVVVVAVVNAVVAVVDSVVAVINPLVSLISFVRGHGCCCLAKDVSLGTLTGLFSLN